MTYYKGSFHEELHLKFMEKLKAKDREYSSFSYVAAAIGKEDILSALDYYSIDYEALWDMSKVWSNSEKAMLEVAFQLFNGSNFFVDETEQLLFSSVSSIFKSLDPANSKVVIEGITQRYM